MATTRQRLINKYGINGLTVRGAPPATKTRSDRPFVALTIAITKGIVIALFFMHIKGSSRLLHLAAAAGVIWLLIMTSLTLSDHSTCGWVPLNH